MAKFISRFFSVIFVMLIGLVDFRAWEDSISNPPAAMAAMIFFIFLQIPYIVIVGILYLIQKHKKKRNNFLLEHLIVVSVASVGFLIITFILMNI